jgi:hypothetical protein
MSLEYKYDRILGTGRESDSLGTSPSPFPSTGLYMYSDDGSILWLMTLDATGAWVATDVTPATGTTGTPMGLLLSLTYSS